MTVTFHGVGPSLPPCGQAVVKWDFHLNEPSVALVLGVLPGTGLLSGCCFSIWGFKKSSWKDMELGPGHCRDRKLGTPWYLPNPTQVAVGRPETSQEGMDKGTQARR